MQNPCFRFGLMVFGLALPLAGLWSCAGGESGPAAPTVLMTEEEETFETPPPLAEPAEGPISIRFRPPDPDGSWAYRLVLEASGQQELSVSTENRKRDPVDQSLLLEIEFAELPAKAKPGSGDGGAYLLRLDALHVEVLQSKRPPREIELAGDRLRILVDEKVDTDLEGAQPKEGLTPRMIINRVFGLVLHDPAGNPISIQTRGQPRVRDFLGQFPLREGIAFSRVARPMEPIEPGYDWVAERFLPNAVGALGLKLDVNYSLTGFADVDGVPCAWIRLESNADGSNYPSAAGFNFDRVRAELKGEAWIELETSRLRRMVIFDESRAAYTRGDPPGPVSIQRMRYKGRMRIELIDPNEADETWADGKQRFRPI